MHKFSAAIGEVVSPIVLMVFIGYCIGQYSGRMVLSIIVCILLGFIVAVVNVWKIMKKLSRGDD